MQLLYAQVVLGKRPPAQVAEDQGDRAPASIGASLNMYGWEGMRVKALSKLSLSEVSQMLRDLRGQRLWIVGGKRREVAPS